VLKNWFEYAKALPNIIPEIDKGRVLNLKLDIHTLKLVINLRNPFFIKVWGSFF